MSPELRLNRSLTHDAFPHRCRPGDLEFEVVEYSLDGESAVEPDEDGLVDLIDYEGWSTATLTVRVEVDPSLLDAVFPEDDNFPGRVIVAGHCRATYLRDRTVLDSAPLDQHTFTAEVELNVEGVGGTVELHPYLIRASSRDPVDDYGVEEGVMLADGPEWTVDVTDDDAGGDEGLNVDRTSFSERHESNEETRFPPEDELYYLDLESDSSEPVLWFNTDHQRVINVVWAGESDYDNLTEELVWNHVLSSVWSRMLTIAALEFDAQDSEWTPEWQAGIFERTSHLLYPDRDPSPRKAAQFLQEEFGQGGHAAATKRIETAVQEILEPAAGFTNHIERLGDE